jgi:hypothetical protein
VREDDLPGAEAPAAWLTYLRGGSAANLRRVAGHNAQDLKSLAGVLVHMAGMGEYADHTAAAGTAPHDALARTMPTGRASPRRIKAQRRALDSQCAVD